MRGRDGRVAEKLSEQQGWSRQCSTGDETMTAETAQLKLLQRTPGQFQHPSKAAHNRLYPMSSPGVCISSLPGAQADPPQSGAERGKNLQVHCPRTLVETTMEKEGGLCCPGWSPGRKMLPVRSSWNPFHQSLLLGRLRPHRRSQCEESSLPASRDGDDGITKGRNLGPQSADGRGPLHTASDSLASTKTSGECCDSWGYLQ